MTDTPDIEPAEGAPKKKSKLPLLLGLVMMLAGGGGGFFAVQLGVVGGDESYGTDTHSAVAEEQVDPLPPVAFVPLDPLVISLPAGHNSTHLRFAAQLEVAPPHVAEVEALKPRIVDVLNGYLRAVESSDFEDPLILPRLRSQMLRRIQVVTGEGRVRDLLIMEFVLN